MVSLNNNFQPLNLSTNITSFTTNEACTNCALNLFIPFCAVTSGNTLTFGGLILPTLISQSSPTPNSCELNATYAPGDWSLLSSLDCISKGGLTSASSSGNAVQFNFNASGVSLLGSMAGASYSVVCRLRFHRLFVSKSDSFTQTLDEEMMGNFSSPRSAGPPTPSQAIFEIFELGNAGHSLVLNVTDAPGGGNTLQISSFITFGDTYVASPSIFLSL